MVLNPISAILVIWNCKGLHQSIWTALALVSNPKKDTPRVYPETMTGNKLINSSFRQDSRNVSFTFALRYYPMPLFKSPVHYEYAYQQYKDIQYHMYEFLITAAFQLNVRK
jgi:hypothetical protein